MKKHLAKISGNGESKFNALFKFSSFLLTKPGFNLLKKVVKRTLQKLGLRKDTNQQYEQLIRARLDPGTIKNTFDTIYPTLSILPKISIVIPVYNPPASYLDAAIQSVINQNYSNWELCISDDKSPNQNVRKLLDKYVEKDNRIKVIFRAENGHISANSNTALSLATGDYVLFMDHDDLLTQDCLFEVVRHINAYPDNQLIYADEDKIDDKGKFSEPHFKPGWAPHNLLSRNYMGHPIIIRKDLMAKVKGFREGYEGSQDHDLLLRATELTDRIGHISKVLYHWRIHHMSVALAHSDAKPYAYDAAIKAIEDAMVRRNTPAAVSHIKNTLGGYHIAYNIRHESKVSVIIPTKDQVVLLKKTIDSIIAKTTYSDYEIIVLNNNSTDPAFFGLMTKYSEAHANFRCIEANFPFNFAKLINLGVANSAGDYILMCNNDIEVIYGDWMSQMVSHAQNKNTGAVGVKLLYPDCTVQHAGVVLGLGGAAGHIFINMARTDRGYFNYLRLLNNYSAVTAACLMCRKEVYLEVGGMDELLDVEYNDVDFCLKLLTHGYYNIYVPTVEVFHYESATRGHPFQSKESWAQHEKDFNIFVSKWKTFVENDPFYNPNLSIHHTDFRIKTDNP